MKSDFAFTCVDTILEKLSLNLQLKMENGQIYISDLWSN